MLQLNYSEADREALLARYFVYNPKALIQSTAVASFEFARQLSVDVESNFWQHVSDIAYCHVAGTWQLEPGNLHVHVYRHVGLGWSQPDGANICTV